MEYNGFVSTLVERSEQILQSDQDDELYVTRLMLLLNTGFALVRDRLRYWDNSDDERLRAPNPWKKIKKVCDSRLKTPITIEQEKFFERFRTCDDWAYLCLPKEKQAGALCARNIVCSLKNAEERPVAELKLDAVMRALRNSFAHGGVLAMSPAQAGARYHAPKPTMANQQIDRVYFVSKWTGESTKDELGWIIMEFGLDALQAFWEDWRALILASGREALEKLERAA